MTSAVSVHALSQAVGDTVQHNALRNLMWQRFTQEKGEVRWRYGESLFKELCDDPCEGILATIAYYPASREIQTRLMASGLGRMRRNLVNKPALDSELAAQLKWDDTPPYAKSCRSIRG